jgi:hypothetical protein
MVTRQKRTRRMRIRTACIALLVTAAAVTGTVTAMDLGWNSSTPATHTSADLGWNIANGTLAND